MAFTPSRSVASRVAGRNAQLAAAGSQASGSLSSLAQGTPGVAPSNLSSLAAQPFVSGQPLVLQSWAPGYNQHNFGTDQMPQYGYVLAGQPIPSYAQATADVNALQGTQWDPSVNPMLDPYVQRGRRDPVTGWGGRDPVTGAPDLAGPGTSMGFGGGAPGGGLGGVASGAPGAPTSPGLSPGLGIGTTDGSLAPSLAGLAAAMGFTGFSPSPAGVVGVAGPDGPTQAQVDQAIADLTATLSTVDAALAQSDPSALSPADMSIGFDPSIAGDVSPAAGFGDMGGSQGGEAP